MTTCTFGSRYARKGVDRLSTADWLATLTSQHPFDAHAYTYESDTRLGNGDEDRAACSLVFLDYDQSNDHTEILERFFAAPEESPLAQFACVYPTLSGMRFVYRLSEPVDTTRFGAIVRYLAVELWRHTTLQVDPSTDQWHRCFRLPSTNRNDGKADGPTWKQPYWFAPLIQEEALLDPAKLPAGPEKLPWDPKGSRMEAGADAPGFGDSLGEDRTRLFRLTFGRSRYKAYLLGEHIPPVGRRDQTLMAIAGEACKVAFQSIPDSTAEEVYLFLRPLTDRLTADGSESWSSKLWRLVQHSWNGEVKKERERREKLEHDTNSRDLVVESMLSSLPVNEVPNDPAERKLFARRHYCLQVKTGAFVITKDGTYSLQPLKTSQLPAHFHDGLSFLDDNHFRNEKGKLCSGQEVLNEFSTIITDVEYVSGETPASKLRIHGNRKVLEVVPFAIRPDLMESAEFDDDIGEWLDSFRESTKLQRWLASSIALGRGPTAALYLHGPARVGKSMLCQGLAEVFDSQPVPGAQAFSDFNDALMRSPVVMVDEGLPTRMTGMDTADMFRSLVTGGPVSVQGKYQDAFNSKIPYRVMFAANSFDMVKHLIGKRTMEVQDREAFRERILVLETGKAPADYLDRKGAMTFTKFHRKGSWLGKECRLARHLLKLYQTMVLEQDFQRDGRLLVEGTDHPAFMLAFDLGGHGHDVVDELSSDIARLVAKHVNSAELIKAITIKGGSVWIKKRPYIKILMQRFMRMRASAAGIALDRFLTEETATDHLDNSQMHRVNLEKLTFCAKAEGLPSKALELLHLKANGVTV